MWPWLTDKPLIEFLGKPLAWHNLKKISESVTSEQFVIVSSSKNQHTLADIALSLGLKAKIAIQEKPSGMADAILSAQHFLDGSVLIVNAEDLLEPSCYAAVLETAQKTKAGAVFTAVKVNKYFPGGYVKREGEMVKGIVEKPGEGKEPSDMVKLVVDYFKDISVLISHLKKAQSEKDDVYETALNQMISDGLEVAVSQYEGAWQALKYPWQVLDLMEVFLKDITAKRGDNVSIASSAVVDGNVVLENGVKVFEGAIIKGPAFIGRGSIVGANSLVRDSIIGVNCVVGYSTEVARSYIGPDSWFHTNYVGDSCLEGDFGAGSGAVLANLRLDNQIIKVGEERIETNRRKLGLIAGKGVRVGVNASTMPGIRVGADSLIGPGVVLTRDIKENTKVTQKADYEFSKNEAVTGYNQFREKLK